MANRLYDKGRELFLLGDLAWDTDVFSLLLIDTNDHAIDCVGDEDRADITAGAEVANLAGNSTHSAALASKTHAAGLADAADATFEAVNGDEVEQLIIYQDHTSGAAANDYLIVSIDTATGLALTPNTGDVTVVWNASGIFRL